MGQFIWIIHTVWSSNFGNILNLLFRSFLSLTYFYLNPILIFFIIGIFYSKTNGSFVFIFIVYCCCYSSLSKGEFLSEKTWESSWNVEKKNICSFSSSFYPHKVQSWHSGVIICFIKDISLFCIHGHFVVTKWIWFFVSFTNTGFTFLKDRHLVRKI